VGQPENIIYSDNGKQIIVERGTKAAVVINLDEQPAQVAIPVTLQNGKYRDAVTKQRFTVKKGVLKGTLAPMSAYVL
jgi:alpha-amylase